MRKIFIIAEAGVNHNGSIEKAKRLVDAAIISGADAVKFQTFNAELMASKYAPKAIYQIKASDKNETQFEMLKRLEFGPDDHRELIKYCRAKKIIFLSSPFDLDSIDLLARLGLKIFKIPSGEITNLPYLHKIGSLRRKVIMSTGMATLKEIKDAVGILTSSGTKKKDITILHCNTEYPTPFKDANLLSMLTIKERLGVKIGYSDHTLGIEAAIAAAALGATVIEKHLTLDKNMSGPDHKASLEPGEFRKMVCAIRNTEHALGDGVKRPSKSETKNIAIVRKSIVALRKIKKGERFTGSNLAIKRPGTGLSPMLWDAILKRRAEKIYRKDEIIRL